MWSAALNICAETNISLIVVILRQKTVEIMGPEKKVKKTRRKKSRTRGWAPLPASPVPPSTLELEWACESCSNSCEDASDSFFSFFAESAIVCSSNLYAEIFALHLRSHYHVVIFVSCFVYYLDQQQGWAILFGFVSILRWQHECLLYHFDIHSNERIWYIGSPKRSQFNGELMS